MDVSSILEPRLTDRSKVSYTCSDCKLAFESVLKHLKARVKKGPLRCKRCAIKSKWNEAEYRAKIKTSQEKIWSDDKARLAISEKSKSLWKNPKYAKIQAEKHSDAIYLEHTRKRSQLLWKDPNFVSNQKSIRGKAEWKASQSHRMKELWSRADYKSKTLTLLARKFSDGYKSSLEITTANILSSLGITFDEQKVVGPWLFDFHVPDLKLFIECQGEYWHSREGAASRDLAKRTYLEKAFPDCRLLYLNEIDFGNPVVAKRKLCNFLGLNHDNPYNEFQFNDILLREISISEKHKVNEFLNSYHYAQHGRAARVYYGAFLGDELIAVCKFAPPVRLEVATSMNVSAKYVLELDRFCIKPDRHKKNFASWMLSRCVKMVYSKYPTITHLVSFADLTYDHLGTIYKASNWEMLGLVPPDYHYVNEEGWMMHKKTLYNHAIKMGMKEADYALKHRYSKVYGKEKHKYQYRRAL